MARREFSRKVKAQAWARCGGRCEKCTAKLFPGKYAYDHDLPDQMGGEPTLENCRVLCDACHDEKTFTVDIPTIRKSDRQRDRHIGALTTPKARRLGAGNHQRTATRPLSKGVGLAYFQEPEHHD